VLGGAKVVVAGVVVVGTDVDGVIIIAVVGGMVVRLVTGVATVVIAVVIGVETGLEADTIELVSVDEEEFDGGTCCVHELKTAIIVITIITTIKNFFKLFLLTDHVLLNMAIDKQIYLGNKGKCK
jgi:hypothetical protein